MAIIDVCTYNGEWELFEIRYNILKDYVDRFVVIEFDKTFSGKKRENYFNNKYDKTVHYYNPEKIYEKYKELAESSPNTKGAEHWKREFMQKESIKDRLDDLKLEDNDIVFISDCDEIVNPMFYIEPNSELVKYKLIVYTYWLNNRSSENFWGTIKARYRDIKNECLNHLRNNHERKNTINDAGWHFTSMHHQIKQKLTDSYTEESYATKEVMDNLEENIKNSKDFLGRDFNYEINEEDWPMWLKENRERYLHLLK